MRSIGLLLSLISLISQIRCEELLNAKNSESKVEVKYAGPIVYTNEKPPIVYFPTPPTTSSTEMKSKELNVSFKNSIEYVPFPYQELPVLIYKSKDNPPLHVVSDNRHNDSSNQLNANIEKRLGEMTGPGNSQRGGRALKWSNFKLFNDIPLVMKAPKWSNSDSKGVNVLSNQFVDINNKSLINSVNTPLSLASAPHVIYSGHPPIHVFPQPIILKEPELTAAEMTSASEDFHSLKKPNSGNIFDISMSASNKHEISANPSTSQFYSYGGTPLGSGGSGKSYGFRVKTRGNKHDTEYSGSQNYDNYDDSYSPQHSDGSSESSSSDDKFKPSNHFSSSSSSSDSSSGDNDKDYDKPSDSYGRERSREKFPKYNANNNWMDLEGLDNGWLSSLLGYNRWPRPRRPMAFMNSPTNEHMMFASTHANPMEYENLALMNPHIRPNGWYTGMNAMRPTASAIRPVYTLSSLFGYRRPPVPAPPTHYIARLNPSMTHPSPNIAPVSLKPMSLNPQYMGLPSVSYPVRVPYAPFMMYGYRRPFGGPTGDLAFAESTRNTSNSADISKWINFKEDIQMSGSQVQPTYVVPPPSATVATAKSTSASTAQNKPPIIIYQGLRPPVHVYKQPNLTVRDNSEVQQNLISALQQLEVMKNGVSVDDTTDSTTITSTENSYYQLYSTDDPNQAYDDSYKSGSTFYINENSAFSPRHSTGEWVPIKQSPDMKDQIKD